MAPFSVRLAHSVYLPLFSSDSMDAKILTRLWMNVNWEKYRVSSISSEKVRSESKFGCVMLHVIHTKDFEMYKHFDLCFILHGLISKLCWCTDNFPIFQTDDIHADRLHTKCCYFIQETFWLENHSEPKRQTVYLISHSSSLTWAWLAGQPLCE